MSEQNGEKKVYKPKADCTEPVYIENAEGKEEEYTLRKLTGDGLSDYLNRQRVKVDAKHGNLKEFSGLFSDLLSRCLFDPKGDLVPAKVINSWPSDMGMDIYKRALKLNGMGKNAEEEAKN